MQTNRRCGDLRDIELIGWRRQQRQDCTCKGPICDEIMVRVCGGVKWSKFVSSQPSNLIK